MARIRPPSIAPLPLGSRRNWAKECRPAAAEVEDLETEPIPPVEEVGTIRPVPITSKNGHFGRSVGILSLTNQVMHMASSLSIYWLKGTE